MDGVSEDAIFGWIANIDRPSTLERVVVHGSDGARVDVHACLPRRDVCESLSLTGRFGFAIPFSMLEGLGSKLRVTDSQGVALAPGKPVTITRRSTQERPDDPAWAVVHIPKTAGTSLRVALAQSVRLGEAVFLYGDGFTGISDGELQGLPEAQRRALRLVMGHASTAMFRCLPRRIEFITVLREPRARLRSHYYHYLAAEAAFAAMGSGRGVAASLAAGDVWEFDNLMVRMISGVPVRKAPIGAIDESHVEHALKLLRTEFRFVALAERMPEHFPALCRALGMSERALPFENTQRMPSDPALDDAVDWDQAMHRNRFDVMLYRRAVEEGLCGRDLLPPGYRALSRMARSG